MCCLGHDAGLPFQSPRFQSQRRIGIAEDVGEVEAALAEQTLRIDGQPAARSEIENIGVMQIAVQHGQVPRARAFLGEIRSWVRRAPSLEKYRGLDDDWFRDREVIRFGTDFKNLAPPGPLIVMPWPAYRHGTDRFVKAVYEYLTTIPCIEGGPGIPPNRC